MPENDDLPGFQPKRKVLFGEKTSPEKLREVGRRFMEAGRYDDALEFFQRTEADDLARQIAEVALEAGNTPLYMRAKKVLGEEISEEEWLRLAEAAERADMPSAARLAYRRAGREERAEEVAREVPGSELRPDEEHQPLPEPPGGPPD